MGRKVFLSVLGTNYYHEAKYYSGIEPKGEEIVTRFIQEQLVINNCRDWTENDQIYIFLTKQAKSENWVSPAQPNHQKGSYQGLYEKLENLHYRCKISPISILEGFSEKEIWNIFETVYNNLEEKDEIYFDVTHAFRSIPMLVVVLINYAKFLKNVELKSISYGAFEKLGAGYEVEKMDISQRNAPILELKSFSDLQDWTSAASEFLSTGRFIKIIEKVNHNSNIDLFDFSNEILTCRGVEIQNGEKILNLRKVLNKTSYEQIPFIAIKEKIFDKVKEYKQEDVLNGFRAVKYCIDFDLVQQGITLLIESIVSKVLVDIGVKDKRKLTNYKVRNVVSVCLQKDSVEEIRILDFLNDREKEYTSKKQKKIIEYSSIRDNVFKLSYKKELTNKVFCELSQRVRNDINHAGYRTDPMVSNDFKSILEEYYKACCELLSCKS